MTWGDSFSGLQQERGEEVGRRQGQLRQRMWRRVETSAKRTTRSAGIVFS
jgi:hypothetical protein